jgi:hypothetical protein
MKRNNFYLAVAIMIVISALILGGIKFFSGEDNWVCQDGQWVKHGLPATPKPTTPCSTEKKTETEAANEKLSSEMGKEPVSPDEVLVEHPTIGAGIVSPVTVKGEALGNWFFEASFPIEVINDAGEVLSTGIAQAKGEWMMEGYVPFEAEISFDAPVGRNGFLVFRNDNPSGDPALAKAYRLPVSFLAEKPATEIEKTVTVGVFFGSEELNPGAEDCSLVFPVERTVSASGDVPRATLEELFKGPSIDDLDDKYYTSINPGVSINSLSVSSSTAKIDLSSELDEGVAGSCRVAAIRSQIERTLRQFLVLQEVIISVNGRVDDILQP